MEDHGRLVKCLLMGRRDRRELLYSADLALEAVKRSGKSAIRPIGPHRALT